MFSSRTIILPVGTLFGTIGSTVAQSSVVPVIEDQIGGMYADAAFNANISTINSLNVYQVPCGSVAAAYNFIKQIQNFLYSHGQGTFTPVIYSAPLTFVSTNPDTGNVGVEYQVEVFGTGFTISGINFAKLDDGAGHVCLMDLRNGDDGIQIQSDTYLVIPGFYAATVAATYTLWFSLDMGASYAINTGLTITLS